VGRNWYPGPSGVFNLFLFLIFSISTFNLNSNMKSNLGSLFTNYICAVRNTTFGDIYRYILFVF
jgi:hypothetical protein